MQSTDPLHTHRAVLNTAGTRALADITGPLTRDELDQVDKALAAIGPMHKLVAAALNRDGTVRDQAAFGELLHAADEPTDPALTAEVEAILTKYGVTAS